MNWVRWSSRVTLRRDRGWELENDRRLEAAMSVFPIASCGLLNLRIRIFGTRKNQRSTLDFALIAERDALYGFELEFQVGWAQYAVDGEVYDARQAERDYR